MTTLLCLCCSSCNWLFQPDMIGWIPFDPSFDDSTFELCNEDDARRGHVRFPRYKEGKRDLKAYFLENMPPFSQQLGENGHIIIRFLVNCKSKSGRFRIEQLDKEYQEKEFPIHISQKLLELLQTIEEWQLPENTDGYGFVTFKIQDGQVVDVI